MLGKMRQMAALMPDLVNFPVPDARSKTRFLPGPSSPSLFSTFATTEGGYPGRERSYSSTYDSRPLHNPTNTSRKALQVLCVSHASTSKIKPPHLDQGHYKYDWL